MGWLICLSIWSRPWRTNPLFIARPPPPPTAKPLGTGQARSRGPRGNRGHGTVAPRGPPQAPSKGTCPAVEPGHGHGSARGARTRQSHVCKHTPTHGTAEITHVCPQRQAAPCVCGHLWQSHAPLNTHVHTVESRTRVWAAQGCAHAASSMHEHAGAAHANTRTAQSTHHTCVHTHTHPTGPHTPLYAPTESCTRLHVYTHVRTPLYTPTEPHSPALLLL